jgi:hypothetical protein
MVQPDLGEEETIGEAAAAHAWPRCCAAFRSVQHDREEGIGAGGFTVLMFDSWRFYASEA